jgi:superoxide reductase
MNVLSEHIQKADWKSEKHVPVIECPDTVKPGELTDVKIGIGKGVAHPNTTEHHIRWIALYFHPEGEKNPFEIGRVEFNAHGESASGPNLGPVYSHPQAILSFKTAKPGNLHALSLCNLHGLWESSKDIRLG